MKIAVIGGGSTYTPELIDGLIENGDSFPVTEVVLMDIAPERLKTVGEFCRRMVAAGRGRFQLAMTTSLVEAVSGADFVVTQIRVGGQEGRHFDICLGKKYGVVGQETTGIGGFSKAMRTIPKILEVCRAIEKHAPHAWLINFTNPSGIVTEAISRYSSAKVIGLCNVPINLQMNIAEALGVPPESLFLDYVGLNHLGWVRHVYYRGGDVIEKVLTKPLGGPSNVSSKNIDRQFLEALRMIPSPYVRYFYNTPEIVREQAEVEKTRAEEVMEVEKELLKFYADPAQNRKPEQLTKRGGAYYSRIAASLMRAIYNDSNEVFIVNVPNNGAVDGFRKEDILELPAVVGNRPPQALAVGAIEPEISGLMSQVKACERLTVEAAVEASYRKALLAAAANPLVNGVRQAKEMLAEIIKHHQLDLK